MAENLMFIHPHFKSSITKLPIGIVEDDVVPLITGIVTVAVDNDTVTVDNDEFIGAPLLALAANVW